MKRKHFNAIALMIAILTTLYFIYIITTMKGFEGSSSVTSIVTGPINNDSVFGGLLSSPYINDTLPHYKYKQTADSLDRINQAREMDNNSIGNGQSVGQIGVYAIGKNKDNFIDRTYINDMDSLNKLIADSLKKSINIKKLNSIQIRERDDEISHRLNELMRIKQQEIEDKEKNDELYYLGLKGYTLDNDSKFYLKNGAYNLLYVKWDSVVKRKYDSTNVGHYESKPIGVRYASRDKRLLIPISKGTYNILITLLNVVFFFLLFISVYIFIGMPVQILINISKGRAFTEKNIWMFKTMSIVLFIYILISTFGQYLLRLLFYKLIPPDFKLPNMMQSLIDNLYFILVSLTLFFISRAFKKGYQLQKEQDLTV